MKKFMALGAILTLSACNFPGGNVVSVETPSGGTVEVAENIPAPKTINGGTGSQCLAVDVLANDYAFIRRGTAGTLEKRDGKEFFVVNGTPHDITGINYSIKAC